MHQRAFLAFTSDGLGIHGLIYQIAQAESGKRLTRYKLSIVPQLSYLALRTNQRIFQHLTVPQIVAQVLQEHGIVEGGYQFLLGPTVYPKRDYCVQYDESDLHFVQRLCEEEGIHYHFQHSAKGHVIVFGDDQSAFGKLGQPTAYLQDIGMTADEPVIKPDDHLTVGQNQHIKLSTAQLTQAGREIHLKAGQKMVIEAGTELALNAGGSFIKLDPGGITLSGPIAKINAGGAAGKGSGIGDRHQTTAAAGCGGQRQGGEFVG